MTIQVDLRSVSEFFAKRGCIPSANPDPSWSGLREILVKSDVYFSKLRLHSVLLALPIDGAGESLKRGLLHRLYRAEKEVMKQNKPNTNDKVESERQEKTKKNINHKRADGRETPEVHDSVSLRKKDSREVDGSRETFLGLRQAGEKDFQKSSGGSSSSSSVSPTRRRLKHGAGYHSDANLQGSTDSHVTNSTSQTKSHGRGTTKENEEGRVGINYRKDKISSRDAEGEAEYGDMKSKEQGKIGGPGEEKHKKTLLEMSAQHEKGRKEIERTINLITHPARSGFLFLLSEYGRTTGVATQVLPQPARFIPRFIFPELDNSLFGRCRRTSSSLKTHRPRHGDKKRTDEVSSSYTHDSTPYPSSSSSIAFTTSLSGHYDDHPHSYNNRSRDEGRDTLKSSSTWTVGSRRKDEADDEIGKEENGERRRNRGDEVDNSTRHRSTSTSGRRDGEEERNRRESESLPPNLEHLVFACPQSGIPDWTWKPVAGALVSFEQFDDREISFVFCHASLPPDARHQLIRVLIMRVIATAFCWFQAGDRPGRGKKLVSTKGVVIPFFPDAARSFLTDRSGLGLACHYDTSEEHTDSHKPDACACHRRLDTFLTNFLERRKERELRKKGVGGGQRRKSTTRVGRGDNGRRGRRRGSASRNLQKNRKNEKSSSGHTSNRRSGDDEEQEDDKEGEEEEETEGKDDRGAVTPASSEEEDREEDDEGDLAWREVADDFVFYGISDARFIQAWTKRGEQLIPDKPMTSILGLFSRNLTGVQENPSSTSNASGVKDGPTLGGPNTSNIEAQSLNLTPSTGSMNQNSLFANEDSEDDDILKIDKKKRKRDRIVMEPSDFPTPPKSSTPSTPPSAFPTCHGDGHDDQPRPQPEQLQGVRTVPGNISDTMCSSSLSAFSTFVSPGPSLTHRTEAALPPKPSGHTSSSFSSKALEGASTVPVKREVNL